jgi:hypothetical protein
MTDQTIRVICPNCATALSVSRAAPVRLICPRCLAKIENPAATGATPRPVIPLLKGSPVNTQIDRDQRITRISLALLLILVFVGLLLVISADSLWFVWLSAAGIIGIVIVEATRKDKPLPPIYPPKSPIPVASPAPESPPPSASAKTLDYRAPDFMRADNGGRERKFMGGIFLALGICGADVVLLAATADSGSRPLNTLCLTAVVGAVIGVMFAGWNLNRRPGWRGFGAGVLVGIGFGMLALGPCGFCYLFTV